MTVWWAVLALAAGCGRIAFDPLGDISDPPTFDRDFTREEFAGITMQRLAVASYIDAAGTMRYASTNEPRFDHDPVTLEPLGLLVEPTRTNLAQSSVRLDDDALWFTNGMSTVAVDVARAPDGSMTAESIDDQDTVMDTRRAVGATVPNDTRRYAFSVFMKAGTRTKASFEAEILIGQAEVQTQMTFDLATGVITSTPPFAVAYGLDRYRDGWFRPWITIDNNGDGNTNALLSVSGDRENIAGTGSVFAWGAQIEVGQEPSSFIVTGAGVTYTRDADVITSDATWLEPDVGTLRVTSDINVELPARQPAVCLLAASSRRACIERDRDSGRSAFTVFDGSANMSIYGASWSRTIPRVMVAAWSAVDAAFWDGGATQSNAQRVPAPITAVGFGGDTTEVLDGHVRRVTYWPNRFANGELAAVSTAP